MKITQPIVEAISEKIPHVVPELSTALSTGMFHPIGGLDPDMSRGPRGSKARIGFWSRFRTARS
ncbi:hypothetical protein GCM10009715_31330 [Paeniglutamicibacter psychrophenolicus]|uniref:Uncharacterized protein n=1 Tax=Paeniglutamicibacter psychrophenolicus TaxID=257454 RepID=A0ABS4W9C0_9MICC|nr:hypothetical protein [Paeniglutamicibacter psychrophenolicus]MBP2372723.1 hypothetical protein [Paeniglutamicibacter psychrophenolicus]